MNYSKLISCSGHNTFLNQKIYFGNTKIRDFQLTDHPLPQPALALSSGEISWDYFHTIRNEQVFHFAEDQQTYAFVDNQDDHRIVGHRLNERKHPPKGLVYETLIIRKSHRQKVGRQRS